MTENFDNAFQDQDPYDTEGHDDPGGYMNRPADGARQASPGDVFAEGFLNLQSSESAGDFLGLDTDLVAGSGPDTSLDLEMAPGYADPMAPAVEAFPGDHGAGYEPVFEQDPDDPYAEADPYAYDDGEDEDYDYADLEGELEYAEEGEGRSVGGLVVGAFVVGLIAVLGFVFGPKFLGDSGAPVEVANTGTTPRTGGETPTANPGDPATATTDPATTPNDPEASVGVESFARGEVTPSPEDFSMDALLRPFTMDGTTGNPTAPTRGGGTRTPTTSTGGTSTNVATRTTGSSAFDPVSALNVDGVSFDPEVFTTEQEWVGSNDLDMIWRGTSVPLQAVFSKAKVHVPRVGNVRVHMDSGAVFQGRLLAVGQSRVWVDMDSGEIGLDGERVTKVERLASFGELLPGPEPQASGRRVRVVLPGGAIFGRVLSVQGDRVVVATEDGGRIQVSNAKIEEVGHSRAIVMHSPAWTEASVPEEGDEESMDEDVEPQDSGAMETPEPAGEDAPAPVTPTGSETNG